MGKDRRDKYKANAKANNNSYYNKKQHKPKIRPNKTQKWSNGLEWDTGDQLE